MKTTLKDLIDAGLISAGAKALKMTYKNTTVEIDLEKDGSLYWNNQSFPTPSNFSLNFKRLINSAVKSDSGWVSISYKGIMLCNYATKISEKPGTPEVDSSTEIITRHHDGRSFRPLCRDRYNEKHSQYGIPCSQHVPDCACPTHRAKTFWRRLTESARVDRNTQMNKDGEYMKFVVGMTLDEYHCFLMDDFRKKFECILPDDVLSQTYSQLRNDSFVIDELYPRCQGQHLVDPHDMAVFLAKVFNYRNTQLLIHNNVEARKHGVDTERYKMLINGSKGGIVEYSAKENFDEIEPSEEAISYMMEFVNRFIEKEPKLEL